MATPLRKEIESNPTLRKTKKSIPTPLRIDIESMPTLRKTKRSLPTPLRKDIESKPALRKTMKSLPTAIRLEIEGQPKLRPTKRIMPLQMQNEIRAQRFLRATTTKVPPSPRKVIQLSRPVSRKRVWSTVDSTPENNGKRKKVMEICFESPVVDPASLKNLFALSKPVDNPDKYFEPFLFQSEASTEIAQCTSKKRRAPKKKQNSLPKVSRVTRSAMNVQSEMLPSGTSVSHAIPSKVNEDEPSGGRQTRYQLRNAHSETEKERPIQRQVRVRKTETKATEVASQQESKRTLRSQARPQPEDTTSQQKEPLHKARRLRNQSHPEPKNEEPPVKNYKLRSQDQPETMSQEVKPIQKQHRLRSQTQREAIIEMTKVTDVKVQKKNAKTTNVPAAPLRRSSRLRDKIIH